jgi:protein-disulfide isomerase
VTRTPPPPINRRARRAQGRLETPAARTRVARRPTPKPAWQSPIAIVSVAALIVGAVIILVATRPSGRGATLIIPPMSYAASQTDGATVGSKTAPVVIQLYADFQCPACKQLVTTELPSLLTDYVQKGTVRIEAQDIDIRGGGNPDESLELAAGAFCAAQQNRYWQYHDLVFWNQGRENQGDHNAAFIASVANQAGVDMTAWNTCDARTDIRKPIKDRTAAAFAQGINSTPTLVINGVVQVGVPAYSDLTALIDRLAAASPAPSGTSTTPAAPSAAASPVPS